MFVKLKQTLECDQSCHKIFAFPQGASMQTELRERMSSERTPSATNFETFPVTKSWSSNRNAITSVVPYMRQSWFEKFYFYRKRVRNIVICFEMKSKQALGMEPLLRLKTFPDFIRIRLRSCLFSATCLLKLQESVLIPPIYSFSSLKTFLSNKIS